MYIQRKTTTPRTNVTECTNFVPSGTRNKGEAQALAMADVYSNYIKHLINPYGEVETSVSNEISVSNGDESVKLSVLYLEQKKEILRIIEERKNEFEKPYEQLVGELDEMVSSISETPDSSYTFEYNAIGDKHKFKGTAYKID